MRTQSPKVEMIDSLFKPEPDNHDSGIIRYAVSYFSHVYIIGLYLSCPLLLRIFSVLHNFLYLDNFRELLVDFYATSQQTKPDRVIIFRYIFALLVSSMRFFLHFWSYFGLYARALSVLSKLIRLLGSEVLISLGHFLKYLPNVGISDDRLDSDYRLISTTSLDSQKLVAASSYE